MPLSSEILTLL